MPPGAVLIATIRNEAPRLDHFLAHYRRLGVVHFLIVDNGSTDGSAEHLADEADVSLWHTESSYARARFGADWATWLAGRYCHGRWVLWVDADELLIYPHHLSRCLNALTEHLAQKGRISMGALLLDLYGRQAAPLTHCPPGTDPTDVAPWFDAHNYVVDWNARYDALWVQGGPRMRAFFADAPEASPALNKIPLVHWRRSFVFGSATHRLLPRRLNRVYDRGGESRLSGVLLHPKFLSTLGPKISEELARREHYCGGSEYRAYAAAGDRVALWTPQSTQLAGDWRQLSAAGLMSAGGWA
ncbi:MAG: glycosyltransferase family 2 protein [Pseudomonadota bacterium]